MKIDTKKAGESPHLPSYYLSFDRTLSTVDSHFMS